MDASPPSRGLLKLAAKRKRNAVSISPCSDDSLLDPRIPPSYQSEMDQGEEGVRGGIKMKAMYAPSRTPSLQSVS